MEERILLYEEIPKVCDHVDKTKRSRVLLSRFQAKLYKKMAEHSLKPLRKLAYILDMCAYASVLGCVLLFAKNLFLLAYFHRHDDHSLKAIEFEERGDKVLVTFNPDAMPQRETRIGVK